jgi:hypothetical protein
MTLQRHVNGFLKFTVTLPRVDNDTRRERILWAQQNISKGQTVTWIPPKIYDKTRPWEYDYGNITVEIWQFKNEDDAFLMEMTFGDWQ